MHTTLPWWHVPALLLAAFYLVMAGQNLAVTDPRRPGVAVALVAFAELLVAALRVRRRHRQIGTALLVVGVLPGLVAWWTILAPVAAVLSVAGAVADRRYSAAQQ